MSDNNIKLQIDNIEIPDELHARSLLGIQKARAEMRGSKRTWYKLVATVACLAIMFGSYQVYKTHDPIKSAEELSPGLAAEIKAPNYLEVSIKPEQQEYNLADTVKFSVQIKNVWKETLNIRNMPSILVGPVNIPSDQLYSISLPEIGNRTLKPGETITSSAIWKQNGKPGLYRVEFGWIDLGNTRIGGSGGSFFVKYPPNEVQVKTIDVGAVVKLPTEKGKLTFVLKNIEMNERGTQVNFDFLTDLEAPMGFQMSLARSAGERQHEPAHGLDQSVQNNGIIHGVATFNPVTKDVTKLQIIISDWSVVYKGIKTEVVKGPWIIDVPLK
jgi:hypothetical protein